MDRSGGALTEPGADFLHLDASTAPPRGLTTWRVDAVRAAVVDGRLPAGAALPPSRALARDLGVALGTAGHLTALRRTRVGPFGLGEAVVLPEPGEGVPPPAVEPITAVAERCFPVRRLTAEQAGDVRVGRRLPQVDLAGLTALLGPDGTFLALYRPAPDGARPEAVFV